MGRAVKIDICETTSLTPSYADGTGTIWELGIMDAATGEAYLYRMKPDVAKADPGALRVGRYYERTAEMCTKCTPERRPRPDPAAACRASIRSGPDPAAVAAVVAPMLDDVTLLISVPTFDVPYLKAFLAANGQALTSHHRARDICSMAHGYLRGLASAGGSTVGDPRTRRRDRRLRPRPRPEHGRLRDPYGARRLPWSAPCTGSSPGSGHDHDQRP